MLICESLIKVVLLGKVYIGVLRACFAEIEN